VLVALVACGSDSEASDLGEPFRLAPGESQRVLGDDVRFERVSADSRCPVDVVCIRGGDASVELTVRTADVDVHYTLHTGPDGQPSKVEIAQGRVLHLLALEPAPRSTVQTPPEAYRATLRIDDPTK